MVDTTALSTASTVTAVMAETWGLDLDHMEIGTFDGAGKFTNSISGGLTIELQAPGGASFNVPAGDYFFVIYGMQPGDGFNAGSPTMAGTKSLLLTVGTTQVWKFNVASATTATQLYVNFNNVSLTDKWFYICKEDPRKDVAALKLGGVSESHLDAALQSKLLEIITTQLDIDDLETNFPASNNLNKWAIVRAVNPKDEDGFYQSDGISWIRRLDDSDFKIGDRTLLWDYSLLAGENTFLSTNILNTDAGVSGKTLWTDDAGVDQGEWAGTEVASRGFDDNLTTFTATSDTGFYRLQKMLLTPRALGKFEVRQGGSFYSASNWVKDFKIQGLNDSTSAGTDLTVISVSGNITHIGGNVLRFNSQVADEEVEIITSNTTIYNGYALKLVDSWGGGATTALNEFRGFEVVPATDGVNSVNTVNKVHEMIKNFSTWIEDLSDPGKSLYEYEQDALVRFGRKLYIAKNLRAAGTDSPSVDTTNWIELGAYQFDVTNASTMTFDLDNGTRQVTDTSISQNTTFEISNALAGHEFRFEIPVDATGGYTLTIGTSFENVITGETGTLDNSADALNIIEGFVSKAGDVYYKVTHV